MEGRRGAARRTRPARIVVERGERERWEREGGGLEGVRDGAKDEGGGVD